MMAMPTMAVYSASKFALEGASESLWYEVRPWNITVTLIQPGFVHSDGHLNVKPSRECLKSLKDRNDPYYFHYHSMVPFINRLMDLSTATPEKVAAKISKVIKSRRPPLRVSATLDAHFFILFRRLLPRSLYHWLIYRALPKTRTWGR
jgi:short-subunit dehydrogenase